MYKDASPVQKGRDFKKWGIEKNKKNCHLVTEKGIQNNLFRRKVTCEGVTVDTFNLLVPIVTNIDFPPTISIHDKKKHLCEFNDHLHF